LITSLLPVVAVVPETVAVHMAVAEVGLVATCIQQ
jgi:hypothetical protein